MNIKLEIFDNISLYVRNGERYGHNYYRTLIGARMCSIE